MLYIIMNYDQWSGFVDIGTMCKMFLGEPLFSGVFRHCFGGFECFDDSMNQQWTCMTYMMNIWKQ